MEHKGEGKVMVNRMKRRYFNEKQKNKVEHQKN
jgi:hypothetical protein